MAPRSGAWSISERADSARKLTLCSKRVSWSTTLEWQTGQGLGNRPINEPAEVGRRAGEVHCRERLGSVLRYYC
jgi:hypothetical protein